MYTSRPSRRLVRYSAPVKGRPFAPMASSDFIGLIGLFHKLKAQQQAGSQQEGTRGGECQCAEADHWTSMQKIMRRSVMASSIDRLRKSKTLAYRLGETPQATRQ